MSALLKKCKWVEYHIHARHIPHFRISGPKSCRCFNLRYLSPKWKRPIVNWQRKNKGMFYLLLYTKKPSKRWVFTYEQNTFRPSLFLFTSNPHVVYLSLFTFGVRLRSIGKLFYGSTVSRFYMNSELTVKARRHSFTDFMKTVKIGTHCISFD